MFQYSVGTRQQLPPQLFEQIGLYRREVFITRLGWELNTVDSMELDEFDGPNAIYVCSRNEAGSVNGVARLLPTTAPYLLEKIFPQLWAGRLLPDDAQVWELSRFAAVDFNEDVPFTHQASAQHAKIFLQKVVSIATTQGAHDLVTVSPVSIERLLRISGFRVMRMGACFRHAGDSPIVALKIDCADLTLAASLKCIFNATAIN